MKYAAYNEYKTSLTDWLPLVPAHWNSNRLRHLLSERLQYGANESAELDDPDLPRYVRITDIDENDSLRDETFRSLPEETARPYLLKDGDVLFARSGATSGKTFLYRNTWGRCAYAGYLIRARLDQKKLLPSFLRYFTASSNYWQWLSSSYIQATIQNVSAEKYADLWLPVPPLEEQQTIARFLDAKTAQIDTLVAQKRQLIAKLKEKRSALIARTVTRGLPPEAAKAAGLEPHPEMKDSGVEWLGKVPKHWSTTRLKYAANRIIDCPHDTPIYDPTGSYLVVRTADIDSGTLDLSRAYRVDESEYLRRIRRAKVVPNDILYGREGERWGYAALAPEEKTVCLGQRMMQFQVSIRFDPGFLMWHLNARSVYEQGTLDVAGSTAPHVNVETIRNYLLAEPPLAEQVAIAAFIDSQTAQLDALVTHINEAIARLTEYRQALITSAVTGKTDVRNFDQRTES